jgi:hypothetical protein
MSSNRNYGAVALAMLTAGVLSACGGGGGYGGGNNPPPPPAKVAPTITGLMNQTVQQDSSSPVLMFQVADSDSGVGNLTVTAQSSDTNLIPAAGLVLGGSGANRTLQITPTEDSTGTATITIRVADADALAGTQMFTVMVNGMQVSFLDTVVGIFGDDPNAEPRSLRGLQFQQDANDPTAFDPLLQ